jgi:hypothetical protein
MLRLYRSLLYMYPLDYRREFGGEMQYVFLQAQSTATSRRLTARLGFCLREITGLIWGAFHAQVFSWFGLDWDPFRRFAMRPGFRFPRSTVFLMCVILAGVALAIEKAKTVELRYGAAYGMSGWSALASLALMVGLVGVAVAAAWGIRFALHRSGMHRLSNVQTGPEQR